MQNFAFISTKHYTIGQAVQQVVAELEKLGKDEKTSRLVIHSFNVLQTIEMPVQEKRVVHINGDQLPTPTPFINITVLLVEPDPGKKAALDSASNALANVVNSMAGGIQTPGRKFTPDELAEIEKIKDAQRKICPHDTLLPGKFTKVHRHPGTFYQTCAACGAEVWQDEKAEPNLTMNMPLDPIGDYCNENDPGDTAEVIQKRIDRHNKLYPEDRE